MKFMFDLQNPLTCKPSTTLSNPCNKGRGTYNCKEVFLLPFFMHLCPCVCLIIVSLWCCRWLYNTRFSVAVFSSDLVTSLWPTTNLLATRSTTNAYIQLMSIEKRIKANQTLDCWLACYTGLNLRLTAGNLVTSYYQSHIAVHSTTSGRFQATSRHSLVKKYLTVKSIFRCLQLTKQDIIFLSFMITFYVIFAKGKLAI